ncbi:MULTISPECIES: biotin transporter BioY [Kytococcus]|nr:MULTISPECIES: biotin transporter BioY [Kytococcus]
MNTQADMLLPDEALHGNAPHDRDGRDDERGESTVRTGAQVAVFAALIAALAVVPGLMLFGGQVPVTLQTLGVTLTALALGPWAGAAAVLVYLALIAIGLPVASGGAGGLGVLTGPTGGYLVGFVLGAVVIGLLSRVALRRGGRMVGLWLFVAGLAGVPLNYAVGVPWLKLATGMPWDKAWQLGAAVFVPGDLLKAALAAVVVAAVARALPGSLPADPARR